MERALEEIKLIDQYDYLVTNDKLDIALDKIDTIIAAEFLKPCRSQARIEKFTLER
jgi:guanylate kinase